MISFANSTTSTATMNLSASTTPSSLLGIRLRDLISFAKANLSKPEDYHLTTEQVCEGFIKPLTAFDHLSFVEQLLIQEHASDAVHGESRKGGDRGGVEGRGGSAGDKGERGGGAVGPAQVYVIHTRHCRFLDLVQCLETHFKGDKGDNKDSRGERGGNCNLDTYLWIDVFCVNQHTAATVPLEEGVVKARMQAIGGTVLVLPHWDIAGERRDKGERGKEREKVQRSPLHRTWCLYELYLSASLSPSVSFSIAMTESVSKSYLDAIANDVAMSSLSPSITLSSSLEGENGKEKERERPRNKVIAALLQEIDMEHSQSSQKRERETLLRSLSSSSSLSLVASGWREGERVIERLLTQWMIQWIRETILSLCPSALSPSLSPSKTPPPPSAWTLQLMDALADLYTFTAISLSLPPCPSLSPTPSLSPSLSLLKEAEHLYLSLSHYQKPLLAEGQVDYCLSLQRLASLYFLPFAPSEERSAEAANVLQKCLRQEEDLLGYSSEMTLHTFSQWIKVKLYVCKAIVSERKDCVMAGTLGLQDVWSYLTGMGSLSLFLSPSLSVSSSPSLSLPSSPPPSLSTTTTLSPSPSLLSPQQESSLRDLMPITIEFYRKCKRYCGLVHPLTIESRIILSIVYLKLTMVDSIQNLYHEFYETCSKHYNNETNTNHDTSNEKNTAITLQVLHQWAYIHALCSSHHPSHWKESVSLLSQCKEKMESCSTVFGLYHQETLLCVEHLAMVVCCNYSHSMNVGVMEGTVFSSLSPSPASLACPSDASMMSSTTTVASYSGSCTSSRSRSKSEDDNVPAIPVAASCSERSWKPQLFYSSEGDALFKEVLKRKRDIHKGNIFTQTFLSTFLHWVHYCYGENVMVTADMDVSHRKEVNDLLISYGRRMKRLSHYEEREEHKRRSLTRKINALLEGN